MNLGQFIQEHQFRLGSYEVETVLGPKVVPLLAFTLPQDDDSAGRRLPTFNAPTPPPTGRVRANVANALVRAGAPHPGVTDSHLANLHKDAREHGHVELFVDINSLNQGLVTQLAKSLGHRLSRIVASSSTIDVLHEYQNFARRHHDGSDDVIAGWELARGMRLLRELGVPVYVHQLAPGAARYFRRPRSDGANHVKNAPGDEDREELTYISEDRQMIAAFWHYVATAGPRIPLFLVTADLSLAHVCAAERVPFIFARAPRESQTCLTPETMWFDPYALRFRTCLSHAVLWELALVFGGVNVRAVGEPRDRASFSLRYEPWSHMPGEPEDLTLGDVVPPTAKGGKGGGPDPEKAKAPATSERVLKLSLAAVVDVLPTSPTHKLPVSAFKPKDDDSLRQLWQIGEATGFFRQEGGQVVAGTKLDDLLTALKGADYIRVNELFRAVPGYGRVLREAEEGGLFPPSNKAGAATGWAVTLGAAYKLPGATRFGLADVSDEQFERAIVRAHTEQVGAGARAVPMYRILDRVCSEMRLSPVRFEAMLRRGLGKRGLGAFEAQRARVNGPIPAHMVLDLPSTSAPKSYLRKLSPGSGVVIGGNLVSSLVRRPGRV